MHSFTNLLVAQTNDKLDLKLIFTSGQTFRWRCINDDIWMGVIGKSVLYLKQKSSSEVLWCSPNDPNFDASILSRYLHLDQNLLDLERIWAVQHDGIQSKAKFGKGLRLLRQPFVETLFSFICSSNNNISRISKMVHLLAAKYGKLLYSCPTYGVDFFSFPTVEDLYQKGSALQDELSALSFGYRSKFIYQTVKFIFENWDPNEFSKFTVLPYDDLLKKLVQLPGVGQKVADCVILMSCDKFDVVPIDIHMFNVAQRDFSLGTKCKTLTPKLYREIVGKFQQQFGLYAGWAQLILFASELKS